MPSPTTTTENLTSVKPGQQQANVKSTADKTAKPQGKAHGSDCGC